MKKIVLILYIVCIGFWVFNPKIEAKCVAILSEINKPELVEANNDELFIVEDAFVYVYSLKDYKFLRKFGKKGDGPSEFETNTYVHLRIQVSDNDVFLSTVYKCGLFNRDGILQKEQKFPYFAYSVSPLGKNYVVTRPLTGKNNESLLGVTLVDPQLKEIAVLYQRKYFDYQKVSSFEILPDFIYSRIYNNKIFVFDNRGDFIIRIFDPQGKPAGKIALEYKKARITEEYKKKINGWMKQDPMFKGMPEVYWKMFVFPRYFPVVRNFVVEGNKIYVHTYNFQGEKDEFIILDSNGKIVKRIYLRRLTISPLAPLSYTFYKGNYIYLLENEDTEKWELHFEKVF
ncbi:MAG: hypothetical protein ACM3SY_22010 [Candidatus Omnitrophota bacterium]